MPKRALRAWFREKENAVTSSDCPINSVGDVPQPELNKSEILVVAEKEPKAIGPPSIDVPNRILRLVPPTYSICNKPSTVAGWEKGTDTDENKKTAGDVC
jgi:hypothetical protein